MTAFCPHQDRLHEPTGGGRSPIVFPSRREDTSRPGAHLRRVLDRTLAAFGSRDDGSLQPAAQGNRDPDNLAAEFPQRPLILGDKWDF